MKAENVVSLIDQLVFAKTGKHLSDLQITLLQASWLNPRQSYEEIAEVYNYSGNYLKQDVGPKLWQLLSQVCGEKIKKTNFRAAIERQLQLKNDLIPFDSNSTIKNQVKEAKIYRQTYRDWGEAPDVQIFFDRLEELKQLQQWVVEDRCRLIAIIGMGGMGKTYLSAKLAQQVEDSFEYIVWRSLVHAPPLDHTLSSLLEFLTTGQILDVPVNIDEQIAQLIKFIRQRRCLIVLDNLESILGDATNAGYYKLGYQAYSHFFKLIGECSHQSCVICTSREQPQEISLMQGNTLPVRCLKLKGLSLEAGQDLLKLKGCLCYSALDSQHLIEQYGGNPLALKIASSAIQQLFGGKTTEFIRQNIFVFDEISLLLAKQFNRLSSLGKTFLYWLAINQEPVSVKQLQKEILPAISDKQLIETLRSLTQRSLIETKDHLFALQPVVKEYLLNQLIEQIKQEIVGGELAYFDRHALLEAKAPEYVRKIQSELIVKPLIAQLLTVYGSRSNLEARLKQVILQLQTNSQVELGYAAGNTINLLCHLDSNLEGYDFSSLTIRQAYLVEANLQQVNLAHADLAMSVLPENLTSILAVTFSCDGETLVTGDANGEIRFWQINDGKLIKIYQAHAGWIHTLNFSPDGRLLASGSSDQTIKIWDITSDQCLQTLTEHNQRVRSVAFSPDGSLLASGWGDRTIKLWQVSSGECLQILAGHASYVWSVAFSPDGQLLASGSEDRTVKLWSVASGSCIQTLTGHKRWVRSVDFSPDGSLLASGSGDRTIKLWQVETGKCIQTLVGHTQRVRSVVFSPDGSRLASGSGDHTLRLWQLSSGFCLSTLHGHSSRLSAVAFSPDGNLLASGSEDRSIKLWNVKTGCCLRTWQGYASWIQSVAFSPDGAILASGSEDRTVKLWQLDDGGSLAQVLSGHNGWVCSVAFSPDGNLLASASSDYTVKIWDWQREKCLHTLRGHTRWIRAVAFSPDGQIVASGGGDYTIKLWQTSSGISQQTFRGHQGWIWSVAFSPDGSLLASGSEDRTIRLWDSSTGECRQIFSGHTSWVQSVAFSPDGKTIASGSCDSTMALWDIETGQCRQIFRGHTSWVQSVAFSPDGKTIASGSCDQTVKIWHVNTGQCCQTLREHYSWVWSVAFSPDGETLASGSQDETIRLWQLKTAQCNTILRTKRPLEGACISGTKGLTNAQLTTLQALGAKA